MSTSRPHNVGAIVASSTILMNSNPAFVWTALAQIHGLPGTGEWAAWFLDELRRHKAIHPLLGIGCDPVLVRGEKDEFLEWLGKGVLRGDLRLPPENGPLRWDRIDPSDVLQLKQQ